jgi:ribosome maturation factor RimP
MSNDTPDDTGKVNAIIDLAGVRELAEPLVSAHGLSLFDIEWTKGPGGQILRVFIDCADADDASSAGVTVEHCVAISRDLSTALDAVELISQQYNLEVSSPGLARPLKTQADFSRQVGRLAKLKLKQPANDGQQVLRGELVDVNDDVVTINVDGNPHQVVLDNIHQAKLVFELGGQKKKAQKKSKKGSSGRQRKRTGS